MTDISRHPSAPDAEAEAANFLGGLSELAARSFASTEEAMAAILRLIIEQFGMRTSFLTRITRELGRSEVLAAHNRPGGCDIAPGSLLELPLTF